MIRFPASENPTFDNRGAVMYRTVNFVNAIVRQSTIVILPLFMREDD